MKFGIRRHIDLGYIKCVSQHCNITYCDVIVRIVCQGTEYRLNISYQPNSLKKVIIVCIH